VQNFDQIALSTGTHAQAMAFVQIKVHGESFVGISQNEDIMTATINSVLAGINSYLEYSKVAA
jgi:2-isopropylmalate synthase